MREIKFRAWYNNKELLDVDTIFFDGDNPFVYLRKGETRFGQGSCPVVLEQFTNNHDYYTKEELFEGDVMERDGKRFVIKFNGCGFVGEQIGKPNFLLSLCLLCHLTSEFRLPGKKIGNIHDNPELLEINPCHQ